MARGWAAGPGGPDEMVFCDLDAERARALAEEVGGETRASLAELAAESDAILLAVKPAALADAARELGGDVRALISVLAATPVERIAEAFPGVAAIRVMPNQPVAVRRGVLCYAAPREADEATAALLALLEPLGRLVAVEERLIEAAMAVMSCSPAYVALFAEALAEAGTDEGLEPQIAAELVAETLVGTGELLRVRDARSVRAAVAPPGGATEAGLEALERGGFETALADAVTASLERFR